uniref:Uncharacterized protein n=1 Tax=Utricularia reniformis TaxID=192314 RepID=A0A1Y0B0Z0_9LAMI|nr:hypothetical protein AEK19_MT0802 [Utricularia reniformis]ART31041.1 hypothetical protein AEK19_MT0802 [Utricularia reniformis]
MVGCGCIQQIQADKALLEEEERVIDSPHLPRFLGFCGTSRGSNGKDRFRIESYFVEFKRLTVIHLP